MNTKTVKKEVKTAYGAIAKGKNSDGCCSTEFNNSDMQVNYRGIDGYEKDADLYLGCGIPTEIAQIRKGDTVIDLGSGAGNDAFIARRIVGETGKVIGIDMTPEMVIRSLQNNQKLGYRNVEFILGEIENMESISSNTADVVLSNCVLNLVPDKEKAFREIHRVLKTGGHFSISDIVYKGELPTSVLKSAEMYAGCVAGAMEKGQYLGIVKSTGFKNIGIKKERKIELPDELLLKYLSFEELEAYKASNSGIYSITLYAEKQNEGSCCNTSENGCCTESEVKNTTPAAAACCGSGGGGSGCC